MMTTKSSFAVTAALLAALAAVSGCDYAQRREQRDERSDSRYQAAAADYAAGRLDAAEAGFEKVVRADPGNASARFQLACLLHDRRRDYLGALCQYREFLALEPSSDKAKLAKDRAALCEKQFVTELARKSGTGTAAPGRDIAAAVAAAAAASNALAAAQRRTAELDGRVLALERENARLRRMVASVGGGADDAPARRSAPTARDLLDDDGDDGGDRLRLSPEARALFEEDERADAPAGSGAAKGYDGPTLVEMAGGGAGGGDAKSAASEGPPHEERPEFYEVQEGDTLYRIALRFYGRRDAWRMIRDANKATISSDARIRVGQKIRLP